MQNASVMAVSKVAFIGRLATAPCPSRVLIDFVEVVEDV